MFCLGVPLQCFWRAAGGRAGDKWGLGRGGVGESEGWHCTGRTHCCNEDEEGNRRGHLCSIFSRALLRRLRSVPESCMLGVERPHACAASRASAHRHL
eukprot:6182157-Pleurochrysis_carterae.AAC.5